MTDTLATEGRRERKKRETRARILRVAQEEFTRRGFESTTVETIAERADISKPTLFNYFPSKLGLLQALLPAVDERFAEAIEATARDAVSTGERLHNFFSYVASMTEVTPQLTRSLLLQSLQVYQGTDAVTGAADPRRFPATRSALLALIDAGILRGEIRTDHSPDQLAEHLTGIYVHQLMTWLINPDYAIKEEMAAAAAFLGTALSPTASG
ncbi:TetR/AcrR family transcriptional regulator [Parahaliea aestuarii]|uniref:TetR/AcrR family transcriptional regulator n=1 Tax=Parahaliea aestuarii TaxID=1852021 RepID=A0A5C9A174_9GAMM|nr:TetR/AcrR family transcriptional regulator [Parahaliea aestuarii]TXS93347.1 TetR/AcrR family transcriptional regulator [Parahaliea aestuarii]